MRVFTLEFGETCRKVREYESREHSEPIDKSERLRLKT